MTLRERKMVTSAVLEICLKLSHLSVRRRLVGWYCVKNDSL